MPVAIALIMVSWEDTLLEKFWQESKIKSAEEAANKILDDAAKEAEAKKKKAILEERMKFIEQEQKLRKKLEKDAEIQRSERRLIQKKSIWIANQIV